MELMEDMSFTMDDENGNEVKYDVLCTFDSEETGKCYIVYTDNTTDDEGYTRIYASRFEEEEEEIKLTPIETDEEWEIVQSVLDNAPIEDEEDQKDEE